MVVTDGVHATEHPLLEVEPRVGRPSGRRELLDPGEEIARTAGVHVRFRRHPAHRHPGAQLLDRTHHGSVVSQRRVDERHHVLAVSQPVMKAVSLHLLLDVRVGNVEAVLMPVACSLGGILESGLVFAHGVVARHAGDVFHSEPFFPEAAYLPDPFLLARSPAVQLLDQPLVVRLSVHLGEVGLFVKIEKLGVLRRGRTCLDAQRFHTFHGPFEALGVRSVREDHLEFALLGIEVLVRPRAVDCARAVAEVDFVLLAGLHAAAAKERRVVRRLVHDNEFAVLELSFGLKHLRPPHGKGSLLGFLFRRGMFLEIYIEPSPDRFVFTGGFLDLLDPVHVASGHGPFVRVGRVSQPLQRLQMVRSLFERPLVVLLVRSVVVDRLHRGQYVLRENVLRQRLTHPGGRSIDSRLAQRLKKLSLRFGPNLHLDHGPLLSLQGLDEEQGVLVLDVVLVEGQYLPLPAE